MFEWFKKKREKQKKVVPGIAKGLMGAKSLAVAIAETIANYSEDLQSGIISTPAYKRKDSNVVDIWRDTRLEALWCLWNYGASDVMLLANAPTQTTVLDAFFEEKPLQYEYPHQPSSDPVFDTLQAICQVYLYLNKAGSAVMDLETDRNTLMIKKKTIFDEFERNAEQLHVKWKEFDSAVYGSGDLPPMPNTILEVLFKDVTKKSKTIALSAQFGPDYEAGILYLEEIISEKLTKKGETKDSIKKQIRKMQETTQKLLSALDPDHM
jgi:hypothetical protein